MGEKKCAKTRRAELDPQSSREGVGVWVERSRKALSLGEEREGGKERRRGQRNVYKITPINNDNKY